MSYNQASVRMYKEGRTFSMVEVLLQWEKMEIEA